MNSFKYYQRRGKNLIIDDKNVPKKSLSSLHKHIYFVLKIAEDCFYHNHYSCVFASNAMTQHKCIMGAMSAIN